MQSPGLGVQGLERFMGSLCETPRFTLGRLQPDEGWIGCLFSAYVFACALAELLACLCDIEDVVDDLKGEAERMPEVCQRAELLGGGIGCIAPS